MISKPTRDRIIKETAKSLEKGTPESVLLRKIVNETKYSISGARSLIQEAKMRVPEAEN